MNRFESVLQLNGYPIKKALKHFDSILAINETNFSDYLSSQREAIVNHHLKNNPFYKKTTGLKTFKCTNWNELPILTKENLQIPLTKRLSTGYNQKNCFINKTSGSSGHPFYFAKDKYAHALTWASYFYRYNLHKINLNKDYQARFYGCPIEFKGRLREKIKDWTSLRYRFNIFQLDESYFIKTIELFKKKGFNYINGYTSVIVEFAQFLERKKLILTQICPELKCCIVTSEMLFPTDRILMEKQFGVPVVNEYGASELGIIAFESTSKKWQINHQTLFVEVLDQNNNPVKENTSGKLVITSLYNKAHPFIRYEIGDLGQIKKDKSIKFPTLTTLTGRINEFVQLPDGKTAPALTFYYITKKVISSSNTVKEFIIKQQSIKEFDIIYKSENELTQTQKNNIEKTASKYLKHKVLLSFHKREQIKRSPNGKLKQFECLIN